MCSGSVLYCLDAEQVHNVAIYIYVFYYSWSIFLCHSVRQSFGKPVKQSGMLHPLQFQHVSFRFLFLVQRRHLHYVCSL